MLPRMHTYGFINAYIRSRLGNLITQKLFSQLEAAATVEEVTALLRTTSYHRELQLYSTTGDIRAVEFALTVHGIDTMKNILSCLSSSHHRFAQALLMEHEVEVVKQALRFWFDRTVRGRRTGQMPEYLYREVLVHNIDIDLLINAERMTQLHDAVKHTPYAQVFTDHLDLVPAEKQLFHLELALDQLYFSVLREAVEAMPREDRKIGERVLALEVDLEQMMRIVRFTALYPPEQRKGWQVFLPGGTIAGQVLDAAYAAQSPEDAFSILAAGCTSMTKDQGSPSRGDVYAKLSWVSSLIQEIQLEHARKLLTGNPFTVGSILAYRVLMRHEINRLVSILNTRKGQPGSGGIAQ